MSRFVPVVPRNGFAGAVARGRASNLGRLLLVAAVLLGTILASCAPAAPTPASAPPASEAPAKVATAVAPASAAPAKAATAVPPASAAPAKAATAAPQVEQKLRIGVTRVAEQLDGLEFSPASKPVAFLIYDMLVRRDVDGKLQPSLAVSWSAVNPTTWQFKLRQGVKFHNGEDFDAQAVKFTIDDANDPANKFTYRDFISTLKEVQVVDKYTVNLITKEPTGVIVPSLIAVPIRPPKYFAQVGRDGFKKAPVGTGPFKVASWKAAELLMLERNPNYWGGAPRLSSVEFRQMPEQSTRAAALQAGEVHLVDDLPVDQITRLESAGLKVDSVPLTANMMIVLTNEVARAETPALSDKRVRQALNYAVDKEAIVKKLMGGRGQVLQAQMVGREVYGFDPNIKAYPYDVEKAKKLLAEAGYPNGFKAKLPYPSGRYPFGDQVVEVVADYLAKVGVQVEPQRLESSAWGDLWVANKLGPITLLLFSSHTNDLDSAVGIMLSSGPRKIQSDSKFDDLVQRERSTVDVAERLKILHELAAHIADQAPVIFVAQLPGVYGLSPKVHDVGLRSDLVWDLSKAYIK